MPSPFCALCPYACPFYPVAAQVQGWGLAQLKIAKIIDNFNLSFTPTGCCSPAATHCSARR
ncbi:hypothetical protein RV134_270031 [Roseovarius sp. EC-HK134]|nr:hypothetical protein RV134_270031 [Roseovarius sp. EC-HK134]VVT13601.1 hypothetical protein RV420_300032 [Roseovarius sp. EC-SD190]